MDDWQTPFITDIKVVPSDTPCHSLARKDLYEEDNPLSLSQNSAQFLVDDLIVFAWQGTKRGQEYNGVFSDKICSGEPGSCRGVSKIFNPFPMVQSSIIHGQRICGISYDQNVLGYLEMIEPDLETGKCPPGKFLCAEKTSEQKASSKKQNKLNVCVNNDEHSDKMVKDSSEYYDYMIENLCPIKEFKIIKTSEKKEDQKHKYIDLLSTTDFVIAISKYGEKLPLTRYEINIGQPCTDQNEPFSYDSGQSKGIVWMNEIPYNKTIYQKWGTPSVEGGCSVGDDSLEYKDSRFEKSFTNPQDIQSFGLSYDTLKEENGINSVQEEVYGSTPLGQGELLPKNAKTVYVNFYTRQVIQYNRDCEKGKYQLSKKQVRELIPESQKFFNPTKMIGDSEGDSKGFSLSELAGSVIGWTIACSAVFPTIWLFTSSHALCQPTDTWKGAYSYFLRCGSIINTITMAGSIVALASLIANLEEADLQIISDSDAVNQCVDDKLTQAIYQSNTKNLSDLIKKSVAGLRLAHTLQLVSIALWTVPCILLGLSRAADLYEARAASIKGPETKDTNEHNGQERESPNEEDEKRQIEDQLKSLNERLEVINATDKPEIFADKNYIDDEKKQQPESQEKEPGQIALSHL